VTRERKRNIQLDVVRGVAILLVFGRHFPVPQLEGPVAVLSTVWYRIGWIGVDLFFVLSGFLIGGLLISESHRFGRINVATFVIRRGLKLYPGYFVFISYLLLMPLAKSVHQGTDPVATLSQMWGALWPNLVFLQNYLGSPAGHTWSLAVEEHFYLLLPFALAALTAGGHARLIVPLCISMAPVFLGLRVMSVLIGDPLAETMAATHLRLDALLWGVGIRGTAQFFPARFQVLREWRSVLVVTGVLLWMPNVFIAPETVFIRTVGLTATFLGSGAFLIAAYHTHAHDFGRFKILAVPVASLVAWIGFYSYGIYLWHVTVFGILEREVVGRLNGLTVSNEVTWLVSVIALGAGAVLVGAAATRVIEVPVLQVRDRIFPSKTAGLPTGPGSSDNVERQKTVQQIALPVMAEQANAKQETV
jgi:peptidoglycan/LPS O-acetylase OafA/YrhL